MWTCPDCEYNVQDHLEACWNCGSKKQGPREPAPPPIILTTAPYLEGYRVTDTVEIISAECVLGLNIFKDFAALLTDTFGGRSESTQNMLREARKVCLSELRKEAALLNADAVIAVDLDYSEISGGGKSMLFLVATGTAVKLEPSRRFDDENGDTSQR